MKRTKYPGGNDGGPVKIEGNVYDQAGRLKASSVLMSAYQERHDKQLKEKAIDNQEYFPCVYEGDETSKSSTSRSSTSRSSESGEELLASPREELFCQEFVKSNNASEAATNAGYSSRHAASIGCDLLRKPRIKDRIIFLMIERMNRVQIHQDRIIQELAGIAFFDPRDLFDREGQIVENLHSLEKGVTGAIKAIKVKTKTEITGAVTKTINLQLWDKIAALELLGRHMGMFDHRLKIDSTQRREIELTIKWDKLLDKLSVEELEHFQKLVSKISEPIDVPFTIE